MKREELVAGLKEVQARMLNSLSPTVADCQTIEAALTALQDREAVVRECAAVCDKVNAEYEEHPEMALTCKAAILKLLEPK